MLSCSDSSIAMGDTDTSSGAVRDSIDDSPRGQSAATASRNDSSSSNDSAADALPPPLLPVPLTPQRVQLLSALYERTGRAGKAKELLQEAAVSGLSSQSDMGKIHCRYVSDPSHSTAQLSSTLSHLLLHIAALLGTVLHCR